MATKHERLADVEVVDGDTVRATVAGRRERVRIIGIDAPELARNGQVGECWSEESTVALRELIAEPASVHAARVDVEGDRDRYDRLLRRLSVNGEDVGEALIRDGHAVSFTSLKSEALATAHSSLEEAARRAGLGLWGGCANAGGPT